MDMDKDMQALVGQNRITTEDTTTEFLMTDYFVSQNPLILESSRQRGEEMSVFHVQHMNSATGGGQ